MDEVQQKLFEEAARPLIAFLCEHGNPHMAVIVTYSAAELFSGEMCFNTDEYIKD